MVSQPISKNFSEYFSRLLDATILWNRRFRGLHRGSFYHQRSEWRISRWTQQGIFETSFGGVALYFFWPGIRLARDRRLPRCGQFIFLLWRYLAGVFLCRDERGKLTRVRRYYQINSIVSGDCFLDSLTFFNCKARNNFSVRKIPSRVR